MHKIKSRQQKKHENCLIYATFKTKDQKLIIVNHIGILSESINFITDFPSNLCEVSEAINQTNIMNIKR